MKRWQIIVVGFILAVLVIIGGCNRPTVIKVKVLKPAQINIGRIRRVAVAPFEGQGGNAVTHRLTDKLFQGKYFTILERQKVGALINEMRLSEVGIVDPTSAAQLGKALGAEAIIFGSVDGYVVKDSRGQEKVTKWRKTGRKVKKKTLFGVQLVDEEKPYEVILPYTIRQGRVAVTFKVIDVETTELLAIKSITREYRQKVVRDPDNPKELKQKDIILDELVDQTTDAFVKLISPHCVWEEREWEPTGTKEGKTAFKCLENELYAEAGEILDRLMDNPELKPEQKAAIYYDRGLVYEVMGNLNKAEEWYGKAVTLRGSNLHLKALRNIRKRIEEVKKLQEQQL